MFRPLPHFHTLNLLVLEPLKPNKHLTNRYTQQTHVNQRNQYYHILQILPANLQHHIQLIKLGNHSSYVNSVCFSPNGTTLASGSYDKSIRLWDVKTRQLKAKLEGHQNDVKAVCFSPDGSTLASGSRDNSIRLWDVKTVQQMLEFEGHSNSVCFSPDGSTLASGDYEKSIRLCDVEKGKQKGKFNNPSQSVISICSPSDELLLTCGSIDNVKTEKEILTQDNTYKDLLLQFKIPLQSLSNNIDRTTLRICQNPILEAQGALIFQGEFVNYQGTDLKQLFKSIGGLILENQIEFQKPQN